MEISKRLQSEQLSLAQRIVDLKKLRKLSQKKLAETSGINVRLIRRIENGETNLEFKTILKLATGFRMEIFNLFDFTNLLNNQNIVANYLDFDTRLPLEQKKLGKRILQICSHRNLNQDELGILSNIASSDLSLYINGEENLVLLTLLKIAIGLEVEISDLFNYDGLLPNNDTFQGKLQL